MRFWILAFVLLAGIIWSAPPPAAAHAQYVSSAPGSSSILAVPPTRVTVAYTEAVEPGSATIRVTNASGGRVDSGPASISAQDPRSVSVDLLPIGPDIYTVSWTALSAVDGHFSAGSFAFAIQNPDGTLPGQLPPTGSGTVASVSPVEVVGRFLSFLGLAIAFGTAILFAVAWIPGVREAGALVPSESAAGTRMLAHWGRVGAILLAVGVALWWSSIGVSLTASPFSIALATRLLSALAWLGCFSLLARAEAPGADGKLPWSLWAAIGTGAFAVLGAGLGTHAAADAGLVGAALDAAHIACVTAWVGGLFALLRLRGILRVDANASLARHVYGRFSRMAFYAVGGVLLAGAGLALLLVEPLDLLLTSAFGWVILTKIGLFGVMVTLGGINRFRLLPAAAGSGDASVKAIGRLTGNVRREVAVGATVLLVAALLTALVPPQAVSETTFHLEATRDGVRFQFEIYPYPRTPGVYVYSVLLWDASSDAEYLEGRIVNLTFTLLDSALQPQRITLDGPHGNHFFLESPAMGQAGTWKIDVLLSRESAFDIRVTFHVVVQQR